MSVVVPARDAAPTLPALLDALAAQDLEGPFEVLVVDDASGDATAALARAHPVVTAVLAGTGDGPGAARNVAIAVARAPVLAFTDADCVPAAGWLRAGVAALEHADLVQGRVEPAGPAGPWDRTVTVRGLSGLWETANLFARTDAVRTVGGFEPWLRPRRSKELGEDVWLGWRLCRAGASAAFAPDALVHHAVVARGPAGFVAERARARFFPAIVRRVPELRATFLWRGRFLNARQARLDLALLGLVGAAGAGSRSVRGARAAHETDREALRRGAVLAGAALALPYARELWRGARGAGRRRAPAVAAVHLAADLTTAGALLVGGLRARSFVG